jgi:hypothetical protein
MNIYFTLNKQELEISIKAEEKKIASSPKDSEIRIKAIENLDLLLEALGSVERKKQFYNADDFISLVDGKNMEKNWKNKNL